MTVYGDSCGGGVSALALTPQGEFGDLPILQGFKPRGETLARPGPHSGSIYGQPLAASFKKSQRTKKRPHPQ
ncbi:hypothetical protein JP39_04565 [Companilactobacillus heilongjiangensis]|uniref:Uncharacterized protein n=1 Tax=Companilactobacillus heilongjiangensis TaxID=1074467 RepID=A0A0K2LBK4_9LACO|nr:hypothetical protein JP39_04565 [Companilactobacillus heilongjiangensis]